MEHLWCHVWSSPSDAPVNSRFTLLLAEPEVANLDPPLRLYLNDEKILRLQISVSKPLSVHDPDPFEDLVDDILDFFLGQHTLIVSTRIAF